MSDTRSIQAIAGVEYIQPGVEAPSEENPDTAARVAQIERDRAANGAAELGINPHAFPSRITAAQLVEPSIADTAAAAIDAEMRAAGMARTASTGSPEKDSRISTRAKQRLMGDEDMGQFLFKQTGTMLPRRHTTQMEPLLRLFGRGIIIIDVFSGAERCAIAFLAPLGQLQTNGVCRWTPGDSWVQQTAVQILDGPQKGAIQVELLARDDIGKQDTWCLGKNRVHKLNDYPRRHLEPMSRIAGTSAAFQLMWNTMGLVFIWEREPKDDLAALVRHIASCTRTVV